jgi:hypothetical protein
LLYSKVTFRELIAVIGANGRIKQRECGHPSSCQNDLNRGGMVSESTTDGYTGDQSTVKQVAAQGGQAVSDVRETATDQAQRVGAEARAQARTVASDVRDKLGEQARTQNDRLVGSIRQTADHLDEMRGDRSGTPAATVVSRVADSGRQLADYLDQHGPDGVLREVQDFARRRPGAFLATAVVAGFVVGRLGKSVAKADRNAGADTNVKPSTDTFASTYPRTGTGYEPAYAPDPVVTGGYADPAEPVTGGYADPAGPATGYGTTGTEYASTGTGTPLVAEPDYPETRP